MKKTIIVAFLLVSCSGVPEQSNNTPITSNNQPVIIIQDSIVCNSDLSLKPTNQAESTPMQTSTTEKGKYNFVFYSFALLIALGVGAYFYKKRF